MPDPDLVKLIALALAYVAAASKLLRATLPFWSYFPPIVQRILPGVVLVLGALPEALTGANTLPDLGVAVLQAVALALPGRHTNQGAPEPKRRPVPPMIGPALLLLALGTLSSQACTGYRFSWPKVIKTCAPSPQAVIEDVFVILSGEGPVDDPLVEVAKRYGGAVVLCTVYELVEQMSRARTPSVAAARGRDFLARVGARVDGDAPELP